MSDVLDQINVLLGRNLFLSKEIKAQIVESDAEAQKAILPILVEMDEKQTLLFRKVLEKNPNFFGDLENMAIHEALKKLVEQEEAVRLQEIEGAEKELDDLLEKL